ncbi:hypothetical protein B0A48_10037 [Cryoendolithus antarcticus]|uniref:Uncharacterized protein n=1 Tax=Cryoendolithus antarcticus TaxID=1507870 RepID=A0A1V8T3V2_9PEZI|nr:hypothetical protein B0A48_10037 [Cryoendolithus antarcticus]
MAEHTGANDQVDIGRSELPPAGLPEDVRRAYGLDVPTSRKDDGFVTESEDEDARPLSPSRDSPIRDHATANKFTYHSRPFTPLTPTRPRLRRLRTGSPTRSTTNSPRSARRTPRPNLDYPLVLLHVTLLPVSLPWSYASLQKLLPAKTWQKLQHLESKISATMLQRGLLIPHPEGDFETLVERLLEALALGNGSVTNCGHFRRPTRLSMDSLSSDSGLGSSVSDFDGADACDTCGETIEDSETGRQAWTVRVFAANGLMEREAWTAAWREMESVDVEIVPRIDGETRRRLEARKREEAAEERETEQDEADRIRELVEEQVLLAHERVKAGADHQQQDELQKTALSCGAEPMTANLHSDLPPIYRPKDIPLTILLRNYIYLLAQDWRNVAIACLALLVLALATTSGSKGTPGTMGVVPAVPERVHSVLNSMPDLSQTISRPASAAIEAVSSTIRPAGTTTSSYMHEEGKSVGESGSDEQHRLTSPVYNLASLLEPSMCCVEEWSR